MSNYSVGLVAGSGIDLAPLLTERHEAVSFRSVFSMPSQTVDGHGGVFVKGNCRTLGIIVQMGRLHIYEGLSYASVVRTVDAMAAWGVKTIVFTNAVGGLRPEMKPGDLAAIDSFQLWPYAGWQLQNRTFRTGSIIGGCLHTGKYIWVPGPNYETPAEIRALQTMGGAVVGMSSAPEAFRCRTLGIRSSVVSCITNNCTEPKALTHEQVLKSAGAASARICSLLRAYLTTVRPG
jgi:purine-nucleoside phosphorylase